MLLFLVFSIFYFIHPLNFSGDNGDILPLHSNPVKLIQLKTKASEPVCCSAISQDATLLSYSDCDAVRVYRISLVSTLMNQSAALLYPRMQHFCHTQSVTLSDYTEFHL